MGDSKRRRKQDPTFGHPVQVYALQIWESCNWPTVTPYIEIPFTVDRCFRRDDTDTKAAGIASALFCVLLDRPVSDAQRQTLGKQLNDPSGGFLEQIRSLGSEMPSKYYALIKTPETHNELFLGEAWPTGMALQRSLDNAEYLMSRAVLLNHAGATPCWYLTEEAPIGFNLQTSIDQLTLKGRAA